MKLTILAENYVKNPKCLGEFGLSVYVETSQTCILFDTGASALFAENAARLGVDLNAVCACVISHGHYDHTNGLIRFLEINDHAKVYIHKDAFGETYGETGGVIDDYECGILWSDKDLAPYADRLVPTDGVTRLTDDILISGTIPSGPKAPSEHFYRKVAGKMVEDDMSHEQFLLIHAPGRGMVLLSGCSHKGIIPAIDYAKTIMPNEPLIGVLAGMHLFAASDERCREEALQLMNAGPEKVIPLHCTGLKAISAIRHEFGDRCLLAGTGSVIRF